MPKPLTVWIMTNWKILKEVEIPDHLTCLLKNLYAGQESTVRTRHGATDWFKIRKEVCQDCILSPSSVYGPITSWQIDGQKLETVTDFIFLGSKITTNGD